MSDFINRIIDFMLEEDPALSEVRVINIEKKLRHEFAGERVYIPKRSGHLHDEIAQRFNGRNIGKLARDMSVSRRTVYRAIHARKLNKDNSHG